MGFDPPSILRVIAEYFHPRKWANDLRLSIDWLFTYDRADLAGDIIAGLTISVMLIPQGMAYALLAGLPPIVGLYASVLPLLVYGLLGSTGIMTLGPTAITSVMTLSIIAPLANGNPALMLIYAGTLALFLGIVYLIMGFMRLGFIVNLLSQPVIVGYVNAAAIIIAVSQLANLLGISIERSSSPHLILWRTLRGLPQTNVLTLGIGLISIVILLFFKHRLDAHLRRLRLGKTVRFVITRSAPLLVTLGGTLLVYAYRLDESAGVRVVGAIPQGLPPLTTEFIWSDLQALFIGAVAIAFVGFMEDISTAKSLTQGRQQALNANQEMIAMGASNVASAISGGMPVTTSISRSAVNVAAGARTGLSSMIAAAMLLLTVLFFTPIFYYLPSAVLGAIIFTSVISLIKLDDFRQIWHYSQIETFIALITVGGVFLVNIQWGILFGVGLMIALYLYRSAQPEITELERKDYSEFYVARSDETIPIPQTLILKINESLYFANAQYLDQYLRQAISQREDVRYLILDCSAVNTIDASAVQILEQLIRDFSRLDIRVLIVGLKGRVYSKIRAGDMRQLIGREYFYSTTHAAVTATGQLLDDQLPI